MAKLKPRGGKSAMGRGLDSLLSDAKAVEANPTNDEDKKELLALKRMFSEINVELIESNPYQPRTKFEQEALDELEESIRIHGVIQPITVRKLADDQYQLISGERRLKASKLAGLEKVPAFIRTANDQGMLEMALIENIQRQDLNPIEVALSYQRLMTECELRQEDLGHRVGKKRATVTHALGLLKLPPAIQEALRNGKITKGHAKPLIPVEKADQQLEIFNRIITEGLSVRNVEEIVRDMFRGEVEEKKKPTQPKVLSPELKSVQTNLTDRLDTKVEIKSSDKGKGEIKIPFQDIEHLNRILDVINPS